jgi:hypothetical protein
MELLQQFILEHQLSCCALRFKYINWNYQLLATESCFVTHKRTTKVSIAIEIKFKEYQSRDTEVKGARCACKHFDNQYKSHFESEGRHFLSAPEIFRKIYRGWIWMHYRSWRSYRLVSKLTTEIQNYTGISDKTLAEFVLDLHEQSIGKDDGGQSKEQLARFKKSLDEVGADFPENFIENIDRLIFQMHPKHKNKNQQNPKNEKPLSETKEENGYQETN